MHKDTKWARDIISLQDDEGKWGWFHSLSQFYNSPITTEQALRRLERLGYTMEDECILRAVCYMNDCLVGKKEIPDRKEKVHDWNSFTSLILATWIRRFTNDNPAAEKVAKQWSEVIMCAFESGTYDHKKYVSAYQDILGLKPKGGRIIDFVSFYPLSLVKGGLDEKTEAAVVDYVMDREDGIYYIYDGRISSLPRYFESRKASQYLSAIELLSSFTSANHKWNFVVDWIISNKNENGKWDMGKSVNDKIYFPLSDNWRKRETREADCTERITDLLLVLSGQL